VAEFVGAAREGAGPPVGRRVGGIYITQVAVCHFLEVKRWDNACELVVVKLNCVELASPG
jgi:hypothetical protein